MASIEEILDKLEKKTNIPKQELNERIIKKQRDLSGLVSLEGAAHLVAMELGVDLLDEIRRKLEIKNVVSGMKNVNVIGRIFKISNVVEFKRQEGTGKVVSLYVGDPTDFVRLSLWDKQTKLVEDGDIRLGDAIQIVNGMARENLFGGVEITLGKYGSIRPVEDAQLPATEDLIKKFLNLPTKRNFIKDVATGVYEIKGNVVHIFKGNFLFDVCPVCGSSLSKARCVEHGEVEPNKSLVISSIVDDGTGDMRAVFFREFAEKICGIKTEELVGLDREKRYELIKERLIGRELLLLGRVKKNKISGRLEIIVSEVKDLNALNESNRLAEEIELKIGG